mmetsp:Transcript_8552/g.9736  ORF Transcript_8552/g.9736 Transcript_8552/m.9736 type:complete len:95 (+) Transcript_8552:151-435(+)|eukprot:CAMPEP_0184019174 /NCGR_PEP_ID=MMETSP0954-20121128/8596_1 /TAXON_ID=627963 /ORGANISM="Aplanochytrium sp, Strain PBS07" /LENGTH=94 /DNA_ID=CAMNT_0026300793 /DNA_START=156 /DNA_END=440 /DNA_ORIENTATION=-
MSSSWKIGDASSDSDDPVDSAEYFDVSESKQDSQFPKTKPVFKPEFSSGGAKSDYDEELKAYKSMRISLEAVNMMMESMLKDYETIADTYQKYI